MKEDDWILWVPGGQSRPGRVQGRRQVHLDRAENRHVPLDWAYTAAPDRTWPVSRMRVALEEFIHAIPLRNWPIRSVTWRPVRVRGPRNFADSNSAVGRVGRELTSVESQWRIRRRQDFAADWDHTDPQW